MRVLLVEDEFLVGAAVEMTLHSMGHEVVGPLATVDAALAALGRGPRPDAAIVDVNLRGRPSEPVARELARRHVPFVFATGYEPDRSLERRYPDALWLRKPYSDHDIASSLSAMAPG